MLEIIKAIALLCQIGAGSNVSTVVEHQLICQKEYIKCVRAKKPASRSQREDAIERCILEKK